ncbi:hypothetical protein ES288_D13G114700v1 [Gossypium darwinii]|uniref:SAUR family protein n=1 Tax=Gossypium darwinii TaxID=34276 RepID=A0A5D1ZX10_GOSDA|nr:hypothetical protein ES288_D13G114700v1 [Gossypium darwinii]
MGFRLPRIVKAKSLKQTLSFLEKTVVPKGHFVVCMGEADEKKRFLLTEAKEEYEFDHPMGALTIPCSKEAFLDLIDSFQSS